MRTERFAVRVADVSSAVHQQLKQLGELRDAGIMTPEEFEAKKAELLARM